MASSDREEQLFVFVFEVRDIGATTYGTVKVGGVRVFDTPLNTRHADRGMEILKQEFGEKLRRLLIPDEL